MNDNYEIEESDEDYERRREERRQRRLQQNSRHSTRKNSGAVDNKIIDEADSKYIRIVKKSHDVVLMIGAVLFIAALIKNGIGCWYTIRTSWVVLVSFIFIAANVIPIMVANLLFRRIPVAERIAYQGMYYVKGTLIAVFMIICCFSAWNNHTMPDDVIYEVKYAQFSGAPDTNVAMMNYFLRNNAKWKLESKKGNNFYVTCSGKMGNPDRTEDYYLRVTFKYELIKENGEMFYQITVDKIFSEMTELKTDDPDMASMYYQEIADYYNDWYVS